MLRNFCHHMCSIVDTCESNSCRHPTYQSTGRTSGRSFIQTDRQTFRFTCVSANSSHGQSMPHLMTISPVTTVTLEDSNNCCYGFQSLRSCWSSISIFVVEQPRKKVTFFHGILPSLARTLRDVVFVFALTVIGDDICKGIMA